MKLLRLSELSFPMITLLAFILSPILSLQEVAAPSFIYVLVIAVPMFVYYLAYIKRTHFQQSHLYAISFFICSIFSTAFSDYGSVGTHTLKFLVFVLYFICITSFWYSKTDIQKIIDFSIFFSVVLAILIILSYVFGYTHVDSTYFNSRYSIGITGLYKNPNYLTSFMNLFLFVMLYSLFFVKIGKRKKLFYISSISTIIVADYLTGTRASLVTVAVVLFACLIKYALNSGKAVLGLIPVVLFAVFAYLLKDDLTQYLDLFLGNRSLVEDEGRVYSWQKAYSYITEAPIWGLGSASWNSIGGGNYYEYLHNIFLELFLSQGLVGLILLFLILFSGFFKTKKRDRFFLLLFMFSSGFPLSFQNGLIEVNFWRFLLLNVLLISYSSYSKHCLVESICSDYETNRNRVSRVIKFNKGVLTSA